MTAPDLEQRVQQALIRDWGYVVGSAGLRQVLGFPSQAALRQAICKGLLPVHVFQISGRKGPFALAHDLAAWLATQAAATTAEPTMQVNLRRPREKKLRTPTPPVAEMKKPPARTGG